MEIKREMIAAARQKAEEYYRSGAFYCSEAVVAVVNEVLESTLPAEIVRLASGFPVGMGGAGCTCGALAGGVAALGLKYGRSVPGADSKQVLRAAKELHDEFKEKYGHTCCRILTRGYRLGSKEHIARCVQVTGDVTEMVMTKIASGHKRWR